MSAPRVAIVLAAGRGTRLGSLDVPKALVDVEGETILARAIRSLVACGVERLIVATGHGEGAVRAALASSALAVELCRNPDFATTQNAVSLALCAEAVRGEAFFKLDGDVLFRADVLERLGADGADLAIALDRSVDLGEEEMKVHVEDGRVTRFGKDLDPREAAGESIGIEKISAPLAEPLFAALARARERGRLGIYYEDVYDELVRDGLVAHAVDVSDLPWIEIDTPEDLERARALVRSSAFA